ncbi:MAG: thiamine-phosphate synthase family protein, partial [Sulfolobales archaeon]|nr:thiamine-phosphate synthase family protein [Sulfolobales archaeon]
PPNAVDFRDVVGFSGRIIRAHNRAIAAGEPTRGGSRHTASVLLKVMRRFPSVRSAVVIRYSGECVDALHSAGMSLVKVGPHSSEGEFFAELGKVVEVLDREPDAVVDIGGLGIEPVIYVLAANAIRAIKKAFICVEE